MRPVRPLLTALAAAALAAALPAPAGAATPCHGAHAAPTSSATLCLLNHERRLNGLGLLHLQPALRRAAQRYSELMVRMGFFGHVAPDGQTIVQRIRATGYLDGVRRWTLGENLARGAGGAAAPAAIIAAWMRSPPHRANILNPAFRDVGIGIAAGTTYTTDFGRRAREPRRPAQ